MNLLDRLLEHDAWTTLQLLHQSRGLSDAQLDQDFDLGHRTLRQTFAHVVYNLEVWTTLMEGGNAHAIEEKGTLNALRQGVLDAAPRLALLARSVEQRDGWDERWTDTLDDPPTRKTYGGGIAHILTHSMHHRAQIIHMLRRLGVPDVLEGDVLSWENQR